MFLWLRKLGGFMTTLKRTRLYDYHIANGAKMVPFAGYEMPVQYNLGVMKEHLHTRVAAGLFDVSHMGQILLYPKSGVIADAALAIETLVPVNILSLENGRQRYGMFTNDDGGILDDLMIANRGDHLYIVVNASCKGNDFQHLKNNLGNEFQIDMVEDRSLIALQGPLAEEVLSKLNPTVKELRFMDSITANLLDTECWISRSGYTGEDGYEISIPNSAVEEVVQLLSQDINVEPIGLGARDSLRLEAGLCLYGHDIDINTSPIEGNLNWAIQKARRAGGERAGGFPGAKRIHSELEVGPSKKRVGILPDGRAPMREGTLLYGSDNRNNPIGKVTSGAFGPSIQKSISMGYVLKEYTDLETIIYGDVRGKLLAARVTSIPFKKSNYKK
jgi:aminomethyltransferase|tara:strand:+ start:276 stop:1439 length:1164 start_codon:yes stop_codon:yes gene_type:complete